MYKIDLPDISLEIVLRLLREHVPDCEVRAFGSRVTGNAKKFSDLDLVLVGNDKLEKNRLFRLKEAFEASDLPFRVDVVDWHSISRSFQKTIETQFVVLLPKKNND